MEDEESGDLEENYYASLNLSRNATPEEIRSAYRRLSKLYHPDKHVDKELHKDAELLFSKIKRAYEVLNDPHQKAIYDSLGIKGLNAPGWEIIARVRTPQEILEEYERLAEERNERRLLQRTNPRGTFRVDINATDIFNDYDDDYLDPDDSYLPYIEISGMSISQSIEAPLTLRDKLYLSGNLTTQNGIGSGSLCLTGKRLFANNSWMEADMAVGQEPSVSLKYFRPIGSMMTNLSAQLIFANSALNLGLRTSLGMPLDVNTQGYLTWNLGINSSITAMVIRNTDESNCGCTLTVGMKNSFVACHYLWKINKQDLKLRVYLKIGTLNSAFEYTAQKKVSEQSSLSATVSVSIPVGITLKIKIIRANQTYTFPIHLCEDFRLVPIVYATATPFIVYHVVKKLIVDPYMKVEKEREIERKKSRNKERTEAMRKEAKAANDLMAVAYERILHEEDNKNGLVILRALYGKESSVDALKNDKSITTLLPDVIDVVLPLQCMVIDSKLILHDNSKSQITGFYDPCIGEDKVLMVEYSFHRNFYEVKIKDDETLNLPSNCHLVT